MSHPTLDPWAWLEVGGGSQECFADAGKLLSFRDGLFDELRKVLDQPSGRTPAQEIENLVFRWVRVRKRVGALPRRLEDEIKDRLEANLEADDAGSAPSAAAARTLNRRLRRLGSPLVKAVRERLRFGDLTDQEWDKRLIPILRASQRSWVCADIALRPPGRRARFAAVAAVKGSDTGAGCVHWFEIEFRNSGNVHVAQHPADPWAIEITKPVVEPRESKERVEALKRRVDFSTAVNAALRAFGPPPAGAAAHSHQSQNTAPGETWSVLWRVLQPGGHQGASPLGPKLGYKGDSATGAFALALARLVAERPCEPRIVVMASALPLTIAQSAAPGFRPVEGIAAKVNAVVALKTDGLKAQGGASPRFNESEFLKAEGDDLTKLLQQAEADFDTIALLDESPGVGSQSNWREAKAALEKARREVGERGRAAAGLSLWNLATGQRWTGAKRP